MLAPLHAGASVSSSSLCGIGALGTVASRGPMTAAAAADIMKVTRIAARYRRSIAMLRARARLSCDGHVV
jgi:hypothetical protein